MIWLQAHGADWPARHLAWSSLVLGCLIVTPADPAGLPDPSTEELVSAIHEQEAAL
jgi:hypothetical protein